MASRDLYKDLSKEWGSKIKKEESRAKKSTIRRLTREERESIMEEVRNGQHLFVFPEGSSLGKCRGPCRMIVTYKEAVHIRLGPCIKRGLNEVRSQDKTP